MLFFNVKLILALLRSINPSFKRYLFRVLQILANPCNPNNRGTPYKWWGNS